MELLERLGIKPESYRVDRDSEEEEALLHQAMAEAETDHLFYNAAK
jgi:hypothetical protein